MAIGFTVTVSAARVLATPVAPAGELIGVELGTPLKPGAYLLDTASYGKQGGPNGSQVGFNIPILIGSLPYKVLGGRIEPFVSQPNLFADGVGVARAGLFNTLVGAGIAWNVGPHLGFSYLLGVYLPSQTTIAFASGSTRQDFALSYGDDNYSLTANLLLGTIFNPVASFSNGTVQRNADYLNIELTAMRKIGAFEFGPVALGSIDLPVSSAFVRAGYVRSGQFALGAIAGYDFGPASLQGYVTRDVAQRGPGGADTRGWARIVVPLSKDAKSALPSRVVEH